MSFWGLPDGTYLTATWGSREIIRCCKPGNQRWWTYSMTSTAAAVTAMNNLVYAMPSTGSVVFVLDLESGRVQNTIILQGANGDSFTSSLYGGLLAVAGYLYHSDGQQQVVYRYNATTGRHDGNLFSISAPVQNAAFNGRTPTTRK